MSKGALAFLAGLGSGYLSEGRRQEDKARQEKFDQIRFDEADRAKSEWDLNEKKRKDIAEAAKDGGEVVEDAQVVSGLAAKPATYQDKDLAASDTREGNRMLRQAPGGFAATQGISQPAADSSTATGSNVVPMAVSEGIVPRESATPTGSQAQPIATQQGVTMAPVGKPMFQGKEYADSGTAKTAAESFNSPDARNARIAQAMRANGDHEGAMRIEANAKQALVQDFQMKVAKHNWGRQIIEEGTADAAKALRAGDALGMETAFNKSGKYKIAPGLQIAPTETKSPDGTIKRTNIATFNILKEDGTIVPMKMSTDELEKTVLSAKEAMALDLQAEANAFEREYKTNTFKEQVRSHKAHEGISYGQLALAQKKDQREAESYKRQSPEGQVDFIEKALGTPFAPDERKKLLLKAAGLGEKVEDHMKLAESLATEAVKAGTLKVEDAPALVQKIVGSFTTFKNNSVLEGVVKTELGKAKGSPEYAGLYQDAIKKNMTPEQLKVMGFDPPQKPTSTATASAATGAQSKPLAVPRASEYKGESDKDYFLGKAKSIASTIGTGIQAYGDRFTEIERREEFRKVKGLIEDNRQLTFEQKKFAIENGMLRKE